MNQKSFVKKYKKQTICSKILVCLKNFCVKKLQSKAKKTLIFVVKFRKNDCIKFKNTNRKDVLLAYKNIDIANKTLIEKQMAKVLEKILFPERQKAMYALMHEMSGEAESNGLTEEIIDEILNEK